MTLKLSILVCSIEPRLEPYLTPLARNLFDQARGLPVEVLVLLDNFSMSTGQKRNHLLQSAQGEWVIFVDDDDRVAPDFVATLLEWITSSGCDQVSFNMEITNDGAGHHVRALRAHAESPIPIHTTAIRRAIATCQPFADTNFGEDQAWSDAVRSRIQSTSHIDRTLYFYDWRSAVSESNTPRRRLREQEGRPPH